MKTERLLTALTLSLSLGFSIPSYAQETYIDNKCKQNPSLNEDDMFAVFYKSEFKSKRQNYWFYSGRYIDGSVIFCVSQPGFQKPRPLNELKLIQFNFIDKVTKDPRNKTAFIVVTREGNGSGVPMNEYRLNFANANKPTLTKLRTWKSQD
ncbi:hypothetical protein H6G54_29195 [Anabaena cylindrica FACHB-243]|uniref:Uncharacterized protein n=1 Tax=Anabaena cylindrica (strain ATCC 27899 / PCC 7122) TaxID=272123 RepID=K9ZPW5_ANACC|nr:MULTISPECIES: hypothetical protein [Anabaena]AFZ61206.1 hypothetical protein Anacy_5917 [Anabaena cylindrica PCC 7122]MBD2421682.1 hypothetical protein [Anabaena cylindrica FACHB-243]MBY5280419.1 hypothetical protein [Anabaena sp. CCAP 1446/1C]MBY5308150.1 hypothetical protein [Anabaena sp. CCAP 1446/1C]MCM2405415.1 hypothetical protein [Anabaena sp. CCAP 1446/1C]